MENMDLVVQTGFRKPLIHLTIKDRHDLISSLLDYHLMAKVKTELDQFKEGLQTFSFLDIALIYGRNISQKQMKH